MDKEKIHSIQVGVEIGSEKILEFQMKMGFPFEHCSMNVLHTIQFSLFENKHHLLRIFRHVK